MELNKQNAEIYLSVMKEKNASKDSLQRARHHIMDFIIFCESKGIVSPTDSDIEKFIQSLEGLSTKTKDDYKKSVKKFLKWLKENDNNKSGGDNNMKKQDNNVIVAEATAQNEQAERAEPIEQGETAEAVEPREKKKAGRPKRAENENKTHKFSIYFPEATYTDLNELCHFYGRSISEQMLKLAEAFINDNQNKLDIFREARSKAFNQ